MPRTRPPPAPTCVLVKKNNLLDCGSLDCVVYNLQASMDRTTVHKLMVPQLDEEHQHAPEQRPPANLVNPTSMADDTHAEDLFHSEYKGQGIAVAR